MTFLTERRLTPDPATRPSEDLDGKRFKAAPLIVSLCRKSVKYGKRTLSSEQ